MLSAEERTQHDRVSRARWKRNNPEAVKLEKRAYWRKRLYGLTVEAWNALFAAQGNVCAVCAATKPGSRNHWHTDHDHVTGKVRGILCVGCNSAIGHAKDDPRTLRALADYVERSQRCGD